MPAFSYICFPRHNPTRSIIVQAPSWQKAFLAASRELGPAIFVFPGDTVPPRDVMPRQGEVEIRGESLGVA